MFQIPISKKFFKDLNSLEIASKYVKIVIKKDLKWVKKAPRLLSNSKWTVKKENLSDLVEFLPFKSETKKGMFCLVWNLLPPFSLSWVVVSIFLWFA